MPLGLGLNLPGHKPGLWAGPFAAGPVPSLPVLGSVRWRGWRPPLGLGLRPGWNGCSRAFGLRPRAGSSAGAALAVRLRVRSRVRAHEPILSECGGIRGRFLEPGTTHALGNCPTSVVVQALSPLGTDCGNDERAAGSRPAALSLRSMRGGGYPTVSIKITAGCRGTPSAGPSPSPWPCREDRRGWPDPDRG